MQIVGVPTAKVVARLWERWRIIATPIVHAEYEGARVTPNVYTTLEEVDTFAAAMEDIATQGHRTNSGVVAQRIDRQTRGVSSGAGERLWPLVSRPESGTRSTLRKC